MKSLDISSIVTSRDIEEEIISSLGEEMSKSIDFDIIVDVLCAFGWTKLTVEYYYKDQRWVDIMDWADQNCTGEYKEHNGTWIFEKTIDATAFALKWV